MIPSTVGRVPRHTCQESNDSIRRQTDESIAHTATQGPAAISRRLAELDREWDIERTLEANAATVCLLGTLLGSTVNRQILRNPGDRRGISVAACHPRLVPAGAGIPPAGVPHAVRNRL